MDSTDIVIVIAGPEEGGWVTDLSEHWLSLEATARDTGWPFAARVVCYSVDSSGHDLPPGARLVDFVSGWEILSCLSDASVVHVSRPHTRAGEIAVLAGRFLGKGVIVSEVGTETSTLGRSFGLATLADLVIGRPYEDVGREVDDRLVEILDTGQEDWMDHLRQLYGRVLSATGVRA